VTMTEHSSPQKQPYPIVIVGHVDHGKSTLIGRLLHETDSLPVGKLDEITAIAKRRDSQFEWSYILDALQLERNQAITIDSAHIWFHSAERNYVIIDAPGHLEFLRNMVTGATSADAAVIVVDAQSGVSEQTRRHAYLLSLLGIQQIIVVINKIDLVGHEEIVFSAVKAEMDAYLSKIQLRAGHTVPVSAINGDNLAGKSDKTPWYDGPTVIAALDNLEQRTGALDQPFRLAVQDVYRREKARIVVGRVCAGCLKVGEQLTFWPTGRSAAVTAFHTWNNAKPVSKIEAGQSVALTLSDEVFVERGHVATPTNIPTKSANSLSVRAFWFSKVPLRCNKTLTMKLGTARYDVVVDSIDRIINVEDLSHRQVNEVGQNDVAEITIRCRRHFTYELFRDNQLLGRAVLLDGHEVVGGCIIEGGKELRSVSRNLTAVPQSVSIEERTLNSGYQGCVLWMTGLSGAGKSTLAMALQRELFQRGINVYTLDGDNIRDGLNRDLGFSEEDRSENIRRVAEVANLFAHSGTIVISAFIAPTLASRLEARKIVGGLFHEIHISADLKTCEARDVKGLYARARSGEIADFTGVSAPWEPPENPELEVNTGLLNLDQSLETLLDYVHRHVLVPKR